MALSRWSLSGLALLALAVAMPANALEFSFGRLLILEPRMEMATTGEDSRLSLRMVNGGYENIHIVAVTSPVARTARMQIATGNGSFRVLPSFTVLAGEGADLSRSNLRITFSGLQRSVSSGERIGVTLHTADGHRIPFMARVGRRGISGAF